MTATETGQHRRTASQRLMRVLIVILGIDLLVTGSYAVAADKQLISFAILGAVVVGGWALGGLIGFLFGVPQHNPAVKEGTNGSRAAQGLPPAMTPTTPAEERQLPAFLLNNNLIEVSNWLTKILLGVGLIELRALPGALAALGNSVASQLATTGSAALAIGLVVQSFVCGFIAAWLWAVIGVRRLLEDSERRTTATQKDTALGILGTNAMRIPELATEFRTDEQAVLGERKVIPALAQKAVELEQANANAARLFETSPGALTVSDHRTLARQLQLAGKFREAAQAYERAFQLDPHDPAPLNFAAVISSRDLKEYDRAGALYEQALKIDPEYVSAWYNSACNEERRGNTEESLKRLVRAVDADPEHYKRKARKDADGDGPFAPLRQDERFTELIS